MSLLQIVADRCQVESATNLTSKEVIRLTTKHYLKNMSKLTEQFFERDRPNNYKEGGRQRVYLKDIDCPEVWRKKLQEHLPPNLFYLNENTGEAGGPGSVDGPSPLGGKKKGKGIAIAGDLMSSLAPPMRAENLMCYIGHEGTYTPAHREMCATLGHNIMVEASDVMGEDGQPERRGSSIWFMTETKDRHMVAEYWVSILGHDIEVEKHFAQINAWKQAPFTTYIVEQRPGDLILIPPLAPHQVWNRGTRTTKVAWNRTTVDTLEMAFNEALPNARMVCRDEQYKNKAIVFFTLKKYAALLAKARDQQQTAASPQEANIISFGPKIKQLQKDFKRLFRLYKDVLLSEMFSLENPHERKVEYHEFESNITCAYCRGNIFNRFLTCATCDDILGTEEPEPYDICMDCYAMGRSCGCISKLKWAEQFKWKELVQQYEVWRRLYIELKGSATENLPLPLQEERAWLNHKTLAQICQEQLKRRPWTDVHKKTNQENEDPSDDNEEIDVNDDGTVKKTKKRHSEAWLKNHHACHVCAKRHPKWKMAECKCGRWFCYGTLFRAFDLMPQTVMEDPDYQCPHCRGICNRGSCRKDSRQTPYEPKGALLGHDTKKVADVRSVESLVDFSVGNFNWLQESVETPADNARLKKRQIEAARAKMDDATIDEQGASDDEDLPDLSQLGSAIDPRLDNGQNPVDPALSGGISSVPAIPVASMLNGDMPLPEYAEAMHSGFVAPAAVMYNAPQPDFHDIDHEIEDVAPDEVTASDVRSGKKRKSIAVTGSDGIQRRPLKKRRAEEDGAAVSGATKEYRKQQERRAMEEARKNGRFISFTAALRGRQRVVKLVLPSNLLRRFRDNEAVATIGPDVAEGEADENVLIRSDIALAKSTSTMKSGPAPAKAPKAVRVRVERDADFRGRVRNRRSDGAAAPGPSSTDKRKPMRLEYEEFELPSDEEEEFAEDGGPQLDGAVEITDTGKKRRRVSAWQAQKHADADDLQELPDDWKDGRKPRESLPGSESTRRASAGKSVAQIRPTLREAEQDIQISDDDDNDSEEEVVRHEDEENRLAKLEAAKLFESQSDESGEADASDDNDVGSPLFPETTERDSAAPSKLPVPSFVAANGPTKSLAASTHTPAQAKTNFPNGGSAPASASAKGVSILSRGGPGGRKIKIVSKASRATINGALPLSSQTNGGVVSSTIGANAAQSSPLPVKGVASSLATPDGRGTPGDVGKGGKRGSRA